MRYNEEYINEMSTGERMQEFERWTSDSKCTEQRPKTIRRETKANAIGLFELHQNIDTNFFNESYGMIVDMSVTAGAGSKTFHLNENFFKNFCILFKGIYNF